MLSFAKTGALNHRTFENLIRLQAAINAFDIKYRLTSIATRSFGVRGKSLPGSHP